MTKRAQVQMAVLAALIAVGATAAMAKPGDMFNQIDANGDGQVTSAELTAAAQARFASSDADNDGFLTPEEMVNSRGGKRAEKMLERFDTDGNGVLDSAELSEAGEGRQGKRAGRMLERVDTNDDGKLSFEEISAQRDPAKLIERLDSNDDGTLSEEEFAQMREQGKKRHGRKAAD